MKTKVKLTMTYEQFSHALFGMGSPGFCKACGDFDEYAGCEPDAENYLCPNCGENELMGLENAMIHGLVQTPDGEEIS